ncbi:MAG: hypothetical protein RIT14_59, partial [Pseudomonadota bacterium]
MTVTSPPFAPPARPDLPPALMTPPAAPGPSLLLWAYLGVTRAAAALGPW